MEPLDLTQSPPRDPRAELAGITFLPRTIDKARASLSGGKLGPYRMQGVSMYLLDGLEIPLDAFVAEVARATSDDEVAAFVRARADDEHVDRWREFILARRPFGGDRDAACKEYPWLSELPELPLTLDVLAEDDRRIFAAR